MVRLIDCNKSNSQHFVYRICNKKQEPSIPDMEGTKENPKFIHAKLEKKLLETLEQTLHMEKVYLQVNSLTYQIEYQLGQGHFGTVYKAKQTTSGKSSAIKVVDFQKALDSQSGMKGLQLAQKEFNLMKQCRSEHVVQAYDTLQTPYHTVIVMEFLRGKTLAQHLEDEGWQLSEAKAVKILKDICEGLFEMHRNFIIHRDLKLENVMIENGIAKIIDLGVGKKVRQDCQYCSTVAGTPYTKAPQVEGYKPYTLSADIYSLGIVFFCLICSKDICPSQRPILKQQMLKKMPEMGFSEAAQDFVRRTTATEPKERPCLNELWSHQLFKKYSFVEASERMNEIKQFIELPHSDVKLSEYEAMTEERFTTGTKGNRFSSRPQFFEDHETMIEGPERRSVINLLPYDLQHYYLISQQAKFILEEIIDKLEDPTYKLIDKGEENHIKLMVMLAERVFLNMNEAMCYYRKEGLFGREKEAGVYWDKTCHKLYRYSKLMDSKMSRLWRLIKNIFTLKIFMRDKEGNRDLTQLQRDDKEKEKNIAETYAFIQKHMASEVYIKSVRARLLAFKKVMAITIEDLETTNFDRIVQDAIHELRNI